MIDSMFMSHQNASKQFERCFSVDFWQNELESLVMAEILDIFKGFPTLFAFSSIRRGDKKKHWLKILTVTRDFDLSGFLLHNF